MFVDRETATLLSRFIREEAHHIACIGYDSYGSDIDVLDRERSIAWVEADTLLVADQLERGEVDPTQFSRFWGIATAPDAEAIQGITNFMIARLRISHIAGGLLWSEYIDDRPTLERLLKCLEAYTQQAIAANTERFLSEFCQEGTLIRTWAHGIDRFGETSGKTSARDLTGREAQIASLVARGMSNAEIASKLGIKISTVKGHMQRIFSKLDVQSRTELALVVTQSLS